MALIPISTVHVGVGSTWVDPETGALYRQTAASPVVTFEETSGSAAVAAADITDAGATGIDLIQAADAAEALAALGLTETADTDTIFLPIANANTTPSTGDAQATFPVPARYNGWNITAVKGNVTTVSSSGTPTMALRRERAGSAVDVLSPNVTIDVSEKFSTTAAVPAVINASNDDLATDDILYGDLDTVGTDAKGHGLLVTVTKP